MDDLLRVELADFLKLSETRILLVGVAEELVRSVAQATQRPVRFITPQEVSPNILTTDEHPSHYEALRHRLRIPASVRLLVFKDIHLFTDRQRMVLKCILLNEPFAATSGEAPDLVWGLIPEGATVGEELGFGRLIVP